MRLLLAVAIRIALLFFFISISNARAFDSNVSQKEFITFEITTKIEAGSIIKAPIQCPPNKTRVGNRCRIVF
ncbi:hypothetical protein ACFW04_003628 [Cataglyphis niger]